MGCVGSKVESEEGVAQCKARNQFMKQAVTSRHALAAAHLFYVHALKATGSALRQFAEGQEKLSAWGPPIAPAMEQQPKTPLTPMTPASQALVQPPPPPMPPSPLSPMLPPSPPPPPPPPSAIESPHPGSTSLPSSPSPPPPPPLPIVAGRASPRASSTTAATLSPIPFSPLPQELPPLVPPVTLGDDDWLAQPPPPPPSSNDARSRSRRTRSRTRSASKNIWDDIFLDPFRPSSPHFSNSSASSSFHVNYMEHQPSKSQTHLLQNDESCQELCHWMQQHEGQGVPDLEDGEDNEVDDDDDDIDGPRPLDSDDAKDAEATSDKALQALTVSEIAVAATSADDDDDDKGMKCDHHHHHHHHHHSLAVTSAVGAGQVLPRGQGRELLDVLREVDDIFLKVVDSSNAVSKFLETRNVHLPSTFSDGFKGVGESARTFFHSKSFNSPPSHTISASILDDNGSFGGSMRSLSNLSSITWNDEGGGGSGSGASGSHALTLDRLYAWEKKLYNEVKEEEVLRLELEKKYVIFARQEKKGEESTMMGKTKVIIKNLQTRKHVASRAVDAAVINIQRLRDEELYPQLLEFLLVLIAMWKDMRECHQAQKRALDSMNSIHKGAPAESTTTFHHQSTLNLEIALFKWGDAFVKVVSSLRNYVKNLNGWLRLSVSLHMGFDDGDNNSNLQLTNRFTSPTPLLSPRQKVGATPIYVLCQKWQSSLELLPDKDAHEAILGYAAVVQDMARLQEQEFRHRQKAERYAKEVEKREAALSNAMSRDQPHSMVLYSTAEQQGGQQQRPEDAMQESAEVADCKIRVNLAKRKYTEEKESERKSVQDTRFMTLNSMQTSLSQVFLQMVTFSGATVESFEKLQSFAQNSKLSRITDS